MTAHLRDKKPLTATTLAPVIITSESITEAEQGKQ
jgi:hypothetical protein